MLAAVPDWSDSWIAGPWPPIFGVIFIGGTVIGAIFFSKNEDSYLAAFFLNVAVWLPLILLNLRRPFILVILIGLITYFNRDWLRNLWSDAIRGTDSDKSGNESTDQQLSHWYKNGTRSRKCYYQNGKLIEATVWRPNGNKCADSKVEGGRGIVVYYNEDGTELGRAIYENGEQIE